jgi:hypothetical protein
MGTKAETIRGSARPAGFTLWTAAVSAVAAAALILSAVALTVAARDRAVTGVAGGGIREAAGTEAPLWDAGKPATQTYRNVWAGVDLEALKEAGFTGRLGGSTAGTSEYRNVWAEFETGELEEAAGAGYTGRLGGSTP